jgi:hypothetical protein
MGKSQQWKLKWKATHYVSGNCVGLVLIFICMAYWRLPPKSTTVKLVCQTIPPGGPYGTTAVSSFFFECRALSLQVICDEDLEEEPSIAITVLPFHHRGCTRGKVPCLQIWIDICVDIP